MLLLKLLKDPLKYPIKITDGPLRLLLLHYYLY